MGIKYTTEIFVKKAISKHGDLCDYSKVDYKSSQEKVIIICKKHGEFKTTPNTHLSGKGTGCMKCRGDSTRKLHRKDKDYFLVRSEKVHGKRYDYSKVNYETVGKAVEIICTEHGSFWQRPDHHYAGSGCNSCQNFGYRSNLEGNFYILKCDNITKVGICNREVKYRINGINKSSKKSFKLYFELGFTEGKTPLSIETEVLKYLKSKYESPLETFDGSTECFYNVDTLELLNKIFSIGENLD